MALTGISILGYSSGSPRADSFRATNPVTGAPIEPQFYSASIEDVNHAALLAERASSVWSRASGKTKGALLRKIAEKIEALGDELTARVTEETALPAARVKSEAARTCFQLRLFAQVVEEGSWVGARIDRADPSRLPLPKPDIRSLWRAIGPVAVFCASNFPLAFSVAGGDTASALAAGNPVVVKAHSAHPGTAEMIGQAIRNAARELGAPDGVFSLLFDAGIDVGLCLVKHPSIRAVGFTGSREGGRALMDAAASRPQPMPVFAEMSSINPVFILPGAMRERAAEIAQGAHASVTLGAGQFCTKPGVIITAADPANTAKSEEFAASLRELMRTPAEFTLLTSRIHDAYLSHTNSRAHQQDVSEVVKAARTTGSPALRVAPVLFETTAAAFAGNPELHAEIFGPSAVLISHASRDELLQLARSLEGHLTATLHGTEQDLRDYADLIAILESKVGRLIFNGYPTGVEVCHAMVHGGPYPATSDGRTTSVGTQAIYRFARLVCFQNFPNASLPDELQDENPLRIWRLMDGEQTRDAISRRNRATSR